MSWDKIATAAGYFFGSFFAGATFILVVEELGDWYSEHLKHPPLWRWWLYSIVSGALIILIMRFIVKNAGKS